MEAEELERKEPENHAGTGLIDTPNYLKENIELKA